MQCKKRNRILVFMIFFGVSIFSILSGVQQTAGYTNANMPNGNSLESHEYSEQSDIADEYEHKNKLVLYEPDTTISFLSEKEYSVYILNESQMLAYLNNQPFIAKKEWLNTTKFEVEISFAILTDDFGLESYPTEAGDEDSVENVPFWILVHNELNETNNFKLNVNSIDKLDNFLWLSSRHLLFITFFSFGIALLIFGHQKKKEEEEHKAHIANNWGFGLITGGFATLTWEILGWYTEFHPEENWNSIFEFPGMPVVWIYAHYLTFISLIGLGLSLLFMSNSVERDVQQKKIPRLTFFLLFMEIMLIAGILFVAILEIIIYVWIFAVALAAFNIFATFGKLVKQTTGDMQKQAIMVLLGIFLSYISLVLRDFIRPDYLMNFMGMIGVYILYKGVKYS